MSATGTVPSLRPRPLKLSLSEMRGPGRARSEQVALRHFFAVILLDILLLNTSLLSFFGFQRYESLLSGSEQSALLLFGLLANALWIGISHWAKVYRIQEAVLLPLRIRDLFWAVLICFGIMAMLYYPYFFPILESHFLLPAMGAFFISAAATHLAFRFYRRKRRQALVYAVVGGESDNLRYLKKVLISAYGDQALCIGRFGETPLKGIAHLGRFEAMEKFVKGNTPINKLMYFNSNLPKETVCHIAQLCRAQFIDFEVVPMGVDFFDRGVQVEQFASLPVLHRKDEPLRLIRNRMLKRVFDILFSLAVMVFLFSWLFPILILLIKWESKGPVFFIQKRTGYWNKPFNCIKFRTMRVNDQSDQIQATRDDDRITRVGCFLRKTNLDELPQFFNVLAGDMSVVGPRPHMLKHTRDYSRAIEQYMIRHEVKPGITGWAQVNGWRGPTEDLYQMAKRVEFDVHYIENWSFWFDCKCIFLTVFNMAKGEENAF